MRSYSVWLKDSSLVKYKNKNWLQFLFIVKAAVLKQQISKFYPQIQCTKASDHIYFSQRPIINVSVTMPNFVKIGRNVPEIWPIFDFSRWRRPPSWFFEISNFLLYSSAYAEPAHVDRFWRSIRHTTCFRPRMCLLGVSFTLHTILGVKFPKTPILGAWIGIFKLNVQNIKICILSKLLHRLQPNFAQSQRPPNTLRGWSQHA